MRTVRLSQRRRAAAIIRRMSTPDVFQVLALLSKRHMVAVDTLAREALLEQWPAAKKLLGRR